jgi:hypothetical protein
MSRLRQKLSAWEAPLEHSENVETSAREAANG